MDFLKKCRRRRRKGLRYYGSYVASAVRATRKNWFVPVLGVVAEPRFSVAATPVAFVVQADRLRLDSTRYVPPSVALHTSVTTLFVMTGEERMSAELAPPTKFVVTT